jgi:hypothetical protein
MSVIGVQVQLIWCDGKTTVKNGKKVTWDQFIEFMRGHS